MKVLSTVFLVCLAMSGAAFGQDDGGQDSLQILLDQQRELQADIDDGGVDGLTARQNGAIRKAQKEVFAVTEGKHRLDELSIDEKIRLENALERINAEIVNTRAAGNDQNVCWRERVSGTGMKKTRCGTAAEMREAREGARDFLERPKVCGESCGSN
ncbi:MAG TPA: hypothetical protein VGD21_00305 [Lysobacter sp.]